MWAGGSHEVKGRLITVLEEGSIQDILDLSAATPISAVGADITIQSEKGFGRVGFDVHIPDTIPVNDAGLSYGQIIEFVSRQQYSNGS